MQLTNEQLTVYQENGFLLLPECFTPAEVDVMRAELTSLFAEDTPRKVVEKKGDAVRSVFGLHTTNEVFHRLSRHPRIVKPAIQIIGSDIYIYQFKVNAKVAFDGDLWEWHQDYVVWRNEDGVPSARLLNVAIFLDDVNEFNGPLFLIPGSHKEGIIEVPAREPQFSSSDQTESYRYNPSWIVNLTARIRYSFNPEIVSNLIEQYGIASAKGPRGSILFFHPNLVHASPNNISPFDRRTVFATYNSLENIPRYVENPRPEFLCSRTYLPLSVVSDDALNQTT
jgi:ectoine hydroxylase-related dioxygenase (phytanoyl-CoA dioxygenase family)